LGNTEAALIQDPLPLVAFFYEIPVTNGFQSADVEEESQMLYTVENDSLCSAFLFGCN
jgi:hypothetical protein